MIEEKPKYFVGVDMAKEGTESISVSDPIKQATLSILEYLDDIDRKSVIMWSSDHPNVVRIKTMTKAMRDEIEKMVYDAIEDR